MSEQINHDRRSFLSMAAKVIAGTELAVMTSRGSQLAVEGELPSLGGATGWLNSQPLTRANLSGKVVLINFWTYSCINWQRTLPYIRAWANKYKHQGLVVVGVHTPEFPFEKEIENVRHSANLMDIRYPIALDSKYEIWRAFDNEYWPALYFVDQRGYIRAHEFGEGSYEKSELVIQQLLAESGAGGFDTTPVYVHAAGAEAAADWADLKSAENYIGYERTENFASPGGLRSRKCHAYVYPKRFELNHWALAGDWSAGKHSIVLGSANGRVAYQFHARDLHLVMGRGMRRAPVNFRVFIDEKPPGSAHGADVDKEGNGTVTEARMYQLIRQPKPIVDRKFEIEFLDPGAEAFSFTFG